MIAAQIDRYGGVAGVSVHAGAKDPILKPGQLLVAVTAASFNPFDGFLRQGFMQERMPIPLPFTAGGDFAGIIEAVGEGATGFSVGDEVFGSANVANGGSGSFAQKAAANAANTARKPKNVDFVQAAALPLVGASAVQALEEHIKLQKGQRILIHGGAGGIGHIAIQLAHAMGAWVATTVRTTCIDFIKSLGADEIVDFTKEDFSAKFHDLDAVFDTVGGDVTTKSFVVLKKGGILVSMKGPPDTALCSKYGVTGVGQGTKTNTAHLMRVAELVDAGTLHINVDKTFPLKNIGEAWTYQETGHPKGKVVLSI